MFRVDIPRSKTRVLHELTRTKMAEDAESKIALTVRFVNENDYKKISTGTLFAKQTLARLQYTRPLPFNLKRLSPQSHSQDTSFFNPHCGPRWQHHFTPWSYNIHIL